MGGGQPYQHVRFLVLLETLQEPDAMQRALSAAGPERGRKWAAGAIGDAAQAIGVSAQACRVPIKRRGRPRAIVSRPG